MKSYSEQTLKITWPQFSINMRFIILKELQLFHFLVVFPKPERWNVAQTTQNVLKKHLLLNEHDFKISKINKSVKSDSPFESVLII